MLLKAVYSEMTLSTNELIIDFSLHSKRISVHLEGPVGGKSCSKTPGSICVNKSCLIQPRVSSSIHTNKPNVRPLLQFYHAISKMSLPVIYFLLLYQFGGFYYFHRTLDSNNQKYMNQ